MVDQMTLQTIGILLTAVTVSIAAVYYTMTLRYTRRNQEMQLETRQAQLFMQIFGRHFERETRENINFVRNIQYENYDDFMDKYGLENNPDYIRISSLAAYFEGIGVLVKRNLIDPTIVDDLMSGPIINYWEQMREYIEERRERTGVVEALEHVEYLYGVVKDIRDRQRAELKT